MGVSVLSPPESEPLSVDEALQHCRIDQDTEDGLIAGYIMAARTYAENFTRRVFMRRVFRYTLDFIWPLVYCESISPFYSYSFYRTRIELPRTPALAVNSVQYVDANGVTQTLPTDQYITLLDEIVPYIEPAFGVVWPVPRYQPAAISVEFAAGFGDAPADIPENIRQALLMLVAFWYDNRGSAQFGARARTGDVTSSVMPSEMPPGVEALLSQDYIARIL